MNLLNEVSPLALLSVSLFLYVYDKLIVIRCEQYGVPTPKSKAAFSASEAREVAKNFGKLCSHILSIRSILTRKFKQVPTSSSSRLRFLLEVEERVTLMERMV